MLILVKHRPMTTTHWKLAKTPILHHSSTLIGLWKGTKCKIFTSYLSNIFNKKFSFGYIVERPEPKTFFSTSKLPQFGILAFLKLQIDLKIKTKCLKQECDFCYQSKIPADLNKGHRMDRLLGHIRCWALDSDNHLHNPTGHL